MIHTIDLHFLDQPHTIAAYLLETSVGPILIETGPHSTFPQLQRGIEQLGFAVSDIQHVFLSHIHLDHAGAAWVFAAQGATIYVHPTGVSHLIDPSRLMYSAKRIYQDQMDQLWGEMHAIPAAQIVATTHGQMVNIGETAVQAWYTPGHAIHHIAWQVGNALFTGDVAGVSINSGVVMPPCPPPDINLEAWESSINLIKGLDLQSLYLTHFGKVTGIHPHLDELLTRLKAWAAWMQPYSSQKDIDQDEIQLKFKKYVANELKENGVSEEGILQYETANPSWMSVVGLLRYWRKRQIKNE